MEKYFFNSEDDKNDDFIRSAGAPFWKDGKDFTFTIKHQNLELSVITNLNNEVIFANFYFFANSIIPQGKFGEVLEFLNDVNSHIDIGTFFIHPDDHLLEFRTTTLWEDPVINLGILIDNCGSMYYDHLKYVLEIAHNNMTADEAIKRIETEMDV